MVRHCTNVIQMFCVCWDVSSDKSVRSWLKFAGVMLARLADRGAGWLGWVLSVSVTNKQSPVAAPRRGSTPPDPALVSHKEGTVFFVTSVRPVCFVVWEAVNVVNIDLVRRPVCAIPARTNPTRKKDTKKADRRRGRGALSKLLLPGQKRSVVCHGGPFVGGLLRDTKGPQATHEENRGSPEDTLFVDRVKGPCSEWDSSGKIHLSKPSVVGDFKMTFFYLDTFSNTHRNSG